MLKIYQVPLGDYQTNCYVITVDERCLIVDPGDEAHKIFTYIKSNNLIPVAILLTHGHFDHIGALEEVKAKYDVPVYVHKREVEFLQNPNVNLSIQAGRKAIEITDLTSYNIIESDCELNLMDVDFSVLHVPGHSPGSVAFYNKQDGVVISGDALFKGSIGRTDLIYGDHNELINSINTKLFILPADTIVYSGHGPATTIEEEMRTNPFFN